MDDITLPPENEYNKDELGSAGFFFSDLLNPYGLRLKLQSCVVPNKKYKDTERTNLDLNNTARKKSKRSYRSTFVYGYWYKYYSEIRSKLPFGC